MFWLFYTIIKISINKLSCWLIDLLMVSSIQHYDGEIVSTTVFSPSRRYSVLGRVLELQDRDQWTSPPSFFLVADSRARRYSQKQRRFDGRSPGCLTGSASTSEGKHIQTHANRILNLSTNANAVKALQLGHNSSSSNNLEICFL